MVPLADQTVGPNGLKNSQIGIFQESNFFSKIEIPRATWDHSASITYMGIVTV